MAALTLEQKATMANSLLFQQRVAASLLVKARYFIDYVTDEVSEFNLKLQSQKRFSKKLFAGERPDMRSFCDYFLSTYTEVNPDLVPSGDSAGQLTDTAIDNFVEPAFNWYAGVRDGDENEQIDW